MQLLRHLFSNYSIFTQEWDKDKKSKLIFSLILSPQIPPHITIDSLVTLWKGYVSENIDTEQPSFSIKQENYTIIANDIIHLMKQLLSQQTHFMILLADWGTKCIDHDHQSMIQINKFNIDPQCEQNIRCIAGINDLFAPYFYLYRDYFRSMDHNDTNYQKDEFYENYKFFQRKHFIKYLIQTSIQIIIDYCCNKIEYKHNDKQIDFVKFYEIIIKNNKHLQNLCKGISLFWSILIRVGYVDLVNKSLIHQIKQTIESKGDLFIIFIISFLIECISKLPGFEKWFESFLITISFDEYHNVSYIENIKFMIYLLHRILNNKHCNSQIEYLLSHKLIINKTLSLHTLDYIIPLLNYLTNDNDLIDNDEDDVDDDENKDNEDENEQETNSCILTETISDIGNVWQSKSFIRKGSYKEQQYLSRALVLLIQYIIQRLTLLNKSDDAANKIPFLFNGVQGRFSSDILEIRHLGMIVAQQYSKVFPNTDALDFGADLSKVFENQLTTKKNKFKCGNIDDIVDIIKVTQNIDNKIDCDFKLILQKNEEMELKSNDDNETGTMIGIDNVDGNDKDNKYIDNEATMDISWLDEMRKQDMENDTDSANVWSSDSDDYDDKNNDDDDDLESYSLSDDEEDLRKVPLPSYLGECLELLNSKQKPDKTESGLIAATTLIRNNPSDLKNFCIALCRTLLHLQNEYSIKNFAIYKRTALVSLIVKCPDDILKYLPFQLYTKEWSVGVKLEILTVMIDAAREMGNLSKLNEMFVDEKKETKMIEDNKNKINNDNDLEIISQNRTNSEKERWKIIDARIAMKTKRWASKPKHVELKENKFAEYATKFVYPLLNGYYENENFLFEFPMLHTRILFCFGCFIECSGSFGIDTINISKDIFELISSIYYLHKLPEIRRTSCFVLTRILLYIPNNILKNQEWFTSQINELTTNLIDIMSNDNDYATRDLAKLCLNQIKSLYQ